MAAFKELYKICNDDYDNNEYLAVKYIEPWNTLDFLPTTSYDVCNVMFINEQKRCHENEAIQ